MSEAVERLNAALEGRYRIEREIGQGGMATVYLADDLRHERKVALKVLKSELAVVVGAERFLAEIKTTANLQHPHILPLHDSGEADGFLFYVMPYVAGESLRDRLDREHQLPVDEAVQIAQNVAEALDYAHKQGVIHRDIKPANILLQSGKPVVSDFGIALAVGAAGGGRLTETGLSLGTPHYMSPEQATGDVHVGPATDVYALGCVLYEMLVGEPPYAGSTPQAILGKIITEPPPQVTKVRKTVPLHVEATIARALEKVPADRFKGAQDFAKALADPGFSHGQEGAETISRGAAGPWNPVSVAMTALFVLAAGVAGWSLLRPQPAPRLARFEVTLPEDRALASAFGGEFALSPDGSRFVYVGVAPGGGAQLWVRPLDELEPHPIPGTGDIEPVGPDVSPDGLSVAYSSGGAIRTVALPDGQPFTVVIDGGLPAWGADGLIYFSRGNVIYRVPEAGGEAEAVTSPTTGEQSFPDPLPDGRGLLLTVRMGGPEQSRIAVVGPEGGEPREILTGTMARYAASGHVVYATAGGTLMAAPFDLKRLEVGPSVSLLEGVQIDSDGSARFTLSETGSLLYGTTADLGVEELVWVSRTGEAETVDSTWTGSLRSPALSPDGRRVAVSRNGDIWVKQLDRGPRLRLTVEGVNGNPTWTPDGGSVTFWAFRAGGVDLWTRRADGSAQALLELDRERRIFEPLWSPDGDWLLFRSDSNARGGGDILAIRRGQDSDPVELVATEFREVAPSLSPDGRWLAYVSNETGRDEVYVRPFPNVDDARWTVSTSGGSWPVWSNSGRELFYVNGEGEMVAVQVETEPTFSSGQSAVLFSADGFHSTRDNPYDVTPDDQRFIMIRQADRGEAGRLIWVLDFFEELNDRVGG